MFPRSLVACVMLLIAAALAHGAILYPENYVSSGYDPGDQSTWTRIPIAAAAGQTVDVMVTGGETVTAAQLYAHIGNGDLVKNEPIFTGVDYTGGIFDDPSADAAG